HQRIHDRVYPFRRDDAAPQQVPDVRAERIDAPLLAVERKRVVAAALVAPERLVEPALELVRLGVEPVSELAVTPHLACQVRDPPLRVVDVPLNLARRARRLRNRAVVNALAV